jgi:hypothetical protein
MLESHSRGHAGKRDRAACLRSGEAEGALRLLRSHHDNNYAGAVNLNGVGAGPRHQGSPAFLVGGLRERELTFNNSMVLHELYFGNLGGDGRAGSAVQAALSRSYGSFGRWEELFRGVGTSLAGGSGWVVLDFNFQTGQLGTHWSGNHTQIAAYSRPLLVMDMSARLRDRHGAAAASTSTPSSERAVGRGPAPSRARPEGNRCPTGYRLLTKHRESSLRRYPAA